MQFCSAEASDGFKVGSILDRKSLPDPEPTWVANGATMPDPGLPNVPLNADLGRPENEFRHWPEALPTNTFFNCPAVAFVVGPVLLCATNLLVLPSHHPSPLRAKATP